MLWTLDNITNVRPNVGHLNHQEWFNSVPHFPHQRSDIARYEILWNMVVFMLTKNV